MKLEKLYAYLSDLQNPMEKRLQHALFSSHTPHDLLHYFACDCAERLILSEQSEQWTFYGDSWNALQVKRRWIEGAVSDNILYRARDDANKANSRSFATEGTYAAAAAAGRSPSSAASDASREALLFARRHGEEAYQQEMSWQLSYIRTFLELYQLELRGLLRLLETRKELLEKGISQMQKELDDALFSVGS